MEGGGWTYRSTTTIAVFSPESGFPYSAKAERGEGGGLTLLCTNSTSSQEKEPITTAPKKEWGEKRGTKGPLGKDWSAHAHTSE